MCWICSRARYTSPKKPTVGLQVELLNPQVNFLIYISLTSPSLRRKGIACSALWNTLSISVDGWLSSAASDLLLSLKKKSWVTFADHFSSFNSHQLKKNVTTSVLRTEGNKIQPSYLPFPPGILWRCDFFPQRAAKSFTAPRHCQLFLFIIIPPRPFGIVTSQDPLFSLQRSPFGFTFQERSRI